MGTDAEGIEGSGEEKRRKARSVRKEILSKHSYQFWCEYTEMWVGAKSACEKAGAELGAREVPDGEVEGRIGGAKSGFAVT